MKNAPGLIYRNLSCMSCFELSKIEKILKIEVVQQLNFTQFEESADAKGAASLELSRADLYSWKSIRWFTSHINFCHRTPLQPTCSDPKKNGGTLFFIVYNYCSN